MEVIDEQQEEELVVSEVWGKAAEESPRAEGGVWSANGGK